MGVDISTVFLMPIGAIMERGRAALAWPGPIRVRFRFRWPSTMSPWRGWWQKWGGRSRPPPN